MTTSNSCFIHFKKSIASIKLPNKFTFPFYYKPHELGDIACEELQEYLSGDLNWKHNFGISKNLRVWSKIPLGSKLGYFGRVCHIFFEKIRLVDSFVSEFYTSILGVFEGFWVGFPMIQPKMAAKKGAVANRNKAFATVVDWRAKSPPANANTSPIAPIAAGIPALRRFSKSWFFERYEMKRNRTGVMPTDR